jgi:hypothetical protein
MYQNAMNGNELMLIINKSAVHCTSDLCDAVAEYGAFLECILIGDTWCLQVLNAAGVNKPFMDSIQFAHDKFCIDQVFNCKPQTRTCCSMD